MTTLSALFLLSASSAHALGAPERGWLTHGGLRDLAGEVAAGLHGAGVGRGDRVAIVLPNGPEMASAFVTVAQAAVTAPLNPAYREEEFAFYLEDLKARAIILPEGYEGPALAAARRFGLVVLRLGVAEGAPAGAFTLRPEGHTGATPDTSAPGPEDVALILHTSGTTSRPKIVPLTQANLVASAGNIGRSLALTSTGLVAAVTASLAAGASVWCAPGFDALKFFGWLRDARPTWYTAVPTMHQAILARAGRNTEVIAEAGLRFLRSSSASLPPQVMVELAQVFGAPVIEGYGMTEAAHQMCSNPLPPRAQKPGSVGVAAGP
ncbi:MAG: AMP-binding protein, partial [Cypionkella sp.]|nr:AMP-binding protein [Cypionkella sp.]